MVIINTEQNDDIPAFNEENLDEWMEMQEWYD